VEFLQVTLSKNFYFDDDLAIEQLQASMTELRRAKLDLPSPGTATLRRTATVAPATVLLGGFFGQSNVVKRKNRAIERQLVSDPLHRS